MNWLKTEVLLDTYITIIISPWSSYSHSDLKVIWHWQNQHPTLKKKTTNGRKNEYLPKLHMNQWTNEWMTPFLHPHERSFCPFSMRQFAFGISISVRGAFEKHCQRHNGPEGSVLIKVTSSYTNLDQIPSSKSQPNISIEFLIRLVRRKYSKDILFFKFRNKGLPWHQHFHQTLTSQSWPFLASESWPNINFITSPSLSSKILTKLQLQNFAWSSTSNSWPNLVLKVWSNIKI